LLARVGNVITARTQNCRMNLSRTANLFFCDGDVRPFIRRDTFKHNAT
jgi:hypothetical protein